MRVRRHGVCVAIALVCTTMYASSAWGVYERDFITQSDFSEGSGSGLTFLSEIGGMTLPETTSIIPSVWAPSPADSTVSRIDSRSGKETARYRIGPAGEHWAPVSVASDSNGNAYIACSAANQPGKIVVIAGKGGMDRNNDGSISTSGDYDSNSTISPSEVLAWGADEKVGFVGEVGSVGNIPSAILCDGGYLWVCLRDECRIAKVELKTGQVLGYIGVVGKPSTIALGLKGSLWVLSTENQVLTEVNTTMNNIASKTDLDFTPGGMTIEADGTLWIANLDGGIACLSTATGEWKTINNTNRITSVAVDTSGNIWGACPNVGSVLCFSREDGSLKREAILGKGASSICVDADGYVWALCDENACAVRIDARSEKPMVVVETGSSPFSSTSFASSFSEKGYVASGSWSTVVDSELNGAGWGRLSWKSNDGGGCLKMMVRVADTPAQLYNQPFKPAMNGKVFGGPNGRFLQVKADFNGMGYATPVLYGLRVEGRNLPPDVSQAQVTCPRIGRIDHVMESVSVFGITDPEGDAFKVVVTGVTQDQQVAGLELEDKSPDAILTGGESVWLRGECAPATAEKPAKGRVYVVAFQATDELGGVSTGSIKVSVAPDIKPSTVVVGGVSIFDSTKEAFKMMAKAE